MTARRAAAILQLQVQIQLQREKLLQLEGILKRAEADQAIALRRDKRHRHHRRRRYYESSTSDSSSSSSGDIKTSPPHRTHEPVVAERIDYFNLSSNKYSEQEEEPMQSASADEHSEQERDSTLSNSEEPASDVSDDQQEEESLHSRSEESDSSDDECKHDNVYEQGPCDIVCDDCGTNWC